MKTIINKIKNFLSNLTSSHFSSKNILLMRFVIGNFLIAFAFILILCVFSIAKTIQIISQNTAEFTNNQIETVASNADYALNDIYKIISTFTTASDGENSFFSFNSWKPEDKYNLDFFNWLTSLRSYIGNYGFLNQVIIYNQNSIIDTKSGIHHPSTYPEFDEISKLINLAKKNYNGYSPYISAAHSDSYMENTEYTKQVISFIAPLNPINANFSHGAIIINVDLSYLSEKLGNNRINSDHMLFIHDEENGIIVGPNRRYNKTSIQNAFKSNVSNSKDTYKIDKYNYYILKQNSNVAKNWTYFMLYNSKNDLAKNRPS